MTRLGQALLAVAWFLATIGVAFAAFGRAVNLGFVGAIAVGLVAAVASPRAFSATLLRAFWPAFSLALLSIAVPALTHGLGLRAGLSASRDILALVWFALILSLGGERAKQALAWAALALLTVNLLLACVSSISIGHFDAFERVQHEYSAGWPRFRGLAKTPAPAGIWALVSIGLTETFQRPWLRRLSRALGLLEACASLSIALLAVPALLAALVPRRWLRRPLVGSAALIAAAVLYFQPLELRVAGHTLPVSRELPEYWIGGLGPEYMPRKTFAVPGMAVTGHVTAYGKLAVRGVTCFAEHPLTGVGPGRFRDACRVMAMNTFGEWSEQRDSHNQAGGLLAERGTVGIVLLSLAWILGRRGLHFQALTHWQRAVWIGLLVCSLGSEDLLALPVLALLASQLAPLDRHPRRDRVIAPRRNL